MALDLIEAATKLKGQGFLEELIYSRNQSIEENYRLKLQEAGTHLRNQIIRLAELRTEEGYMAEVRLLPDGWLLTENHCPIHAAAKQCTHFFAKPNSHVFKRYLIKKQILKKLNIF